MPTIELKHPSDNNYLVGFEQTEHQLHSFIAKNKLPHALILAGDKGIGKSILAFKLARFLLANPVPPPEDMLREGLLRIPKESPIFKRVASSGHGDLLVIERNVDPESGIAKPDIPVDVIRKIPHFLRKTSSEGGWRVVIINDADCMNRIAQNALLKILEEPPQKAILILIAHAPGRFLPTIRSRCRMLMQDPPDKSQVSKILSTLEVKIDDEEFETLYALANGSPGTILELISSDAIKTYDSLSNLLLMSPNIDMEAVYNFADILCKKSAENDYKMFRLILQSVTMQAIRYPQANSVTRKLHDKYGVECLFELEKMIKDIFDRHEKSRLDKRQTIIGIFSMLRNVA